MRSLKLCLLMAAPLAAQQAQQTAEPTVFHADTRVVVCHTTVIDKNGHLVTGLPKSTFPRMFATLLSTPCRPRRMSFGFPWDRDRRSIPFARNSEAIT